MTHTRGRSTVRTSVRRPISSRASAGGCSMARCSRLAASCSSPACSRRDGRTTRLRRKRCRWPQRTPPQGGGCSRAARPRAPAPPVVQGPPARAAGAGPREVSQPPRTAPGRRVRASPCTRARRGAATGAHRGLTTIGATSSSMASAHGTRTPALRAS